MQGLIFWISMMVWGMWVGFGIATCRIPWLLSEYHEVGTILVAHFMFGFLSAFLIIAVTTKLMQEETSI